MRRDKPRPYGEGSVLSFAPRALVQAAPFFGELQVTLGVAERPLFQKAAEPCLPDRGDVTLHRLRDKEAPVSLFRDPIDEPDGLFGQSDVDASIPRQGSSRSANEGYTLAMCMSIRAPASLFGGDGVVNVGSDQPRPTGGAAERQNELPRHGSVLFVTEDPDDVPDVAVGGVTDRPQPEWTAGVGVSPADRLPSLGGRAAVRQHEAVLGEQIGECGGILRPPGTLVVPEDPVELRWEGFIRSGIHWGIACRERGDGQDHRERRNEHRSERAPHGAIHLA